MRIFEAKLCVILGLACVLAAAVPVFGQSLSPDQLKQSDIVFVGTVVKLGAASFGGFPASRNTIVIRVDSVVNKPSAVVLRPGDNVTLVAKDPSQFTTGIHGTFYTAGWIFGDGLAVREIGHELPADPADPPDAAQKKEADMQARRTVSDADMRASIERADLIVVGQVKDVRPANVPSAAAGGTTPITEHDPEWQEAIVHAESVIKGQTASKDVVVHFPASIDVSWYNAPKLKVGEEGTFILQRDKVSGAPVAMLQKKQVPAYLVLEPGDVLSKEEAPRVRGLTTK